MGLLSPLNRLWICWLARTLRKYQGEDSERAIGAARALGETGDTRAVEPLMHALTHGNIQVSYVAARALGTLRAGCAVKPLLALLRDRNAHGLDSTPWTAPLGQIGDPRAIDDLAQALKQAHDDYPAGCAAEALGRIHDGRAVSALLLVLESCPTYSATKAAARVLGQLRERRAVDGLRKLCDVVALDLLGEPDLRLQHVALDRKSVV